jgi:hypothetical protein
MSHPPANYRSYLIRFWRMDNAGQPVWRVGVEEPGSPLPLYFESLAALCTFLAEQLGVVPESPLPPECGDSAPSRPGEEDVQPTDLDQAT